jgi:hypothetical protein
VRITKLSHLKVAVIYSSLQLIVNYIILKTYQLELSTQFIIFFGLILLFILFYISMFKVLEKKIEATELK